MGPGLIPLAGEAQGRGDLLAYAGDGPGPSPPQQLFQAAVQLGHAPAASAVRGHLDNHVP